MKQPRIPMSFREKSAWATLLTTLFIYGAYFVALFGPEVYLGSPRTRTLMMLLGAVAFQIVAMIVIHIVFATRADPETMDERDAAIDLRAIRNGSLVLASGVALAIMAVVTQEALVRSATSDEWQLGPLMVGHLLLLCLVLAQATTSASQVFLYRRGS